MNYKCILFLLIFPIFCFSQEEKNIESIFENIEIQEGNEDIFNLEEFRDLKINLNSANYDELMKIPFFDFYLSSNFLKYRNTYKEIISFYELLEIEGFNEELIEKIKLFCVLDFVDRDIIYFNKNINNIVFRDRFILEERQGYRNNNYNGDKHKTFLGYNFIGSEYLSFGFNLEKDEGENYKNYIDYYSFYLEVKKIKNTFDIYIGDFHTEFGHGFSLWTGYKINKNLNDVSVFSSRGLRVHRGVEENRFMRGLGFKLYYKNIDIYFFVSEKKVDSNLENDTITSFLFTGLHRTENEILNRKNVKKRDIGIILEYKKNDLNLSFISTYTNIDKLYYPKYELYKINYFLGKENYINSFYYNYKIDNIIFFGENGISNDDGFFIYNGFFMQPISSFKFLLSHRYLNEKYFSFYNFPFSNFSNSEKGFLGNFLIKLSKKIDLISYIDFYKNTWITYNLNSLMWAKDFSIQLNYKINRNFVCFLRLSQKEIPISYSKDYNPTLKSGYNSSQNLRIEFIFNLENILLRSRIENSFYTDYTNKKSKGFLFYQNIKYNIRDINIYLRYVMFDIEEWNNRIYSYEDDFFGVFSSNLHYNKGNRYYFMIRYDPLKNIQLWFKISHTNYFQQETIASGNDLIKGNTITELKFQVNIKI